MQSMAQCILGNFRRVLYPLRRAPKRKLTHENLDSRLLWWRAGHTTKIRSNENLTQRKFPAIRYIANGGQPIRRDKSCTACTLYNDQTEQGWLAPCMNACLYTKYSALWISSHSPYHNTLNIKHPKAHNHHLIESIDKLAHILQHKNMLFKWVSTITVHLKVIEVHFMRGRDRAACETGWLACSLG